MGNVITNYYYLLLYRSLYTYWQVQTILANQKKNTRSEGQRQQVPRPILSSTTNLHTQLYLQLNNNKLLTYVLTKH